MAAPVTPLLNPQIDPQPKLRVRVETRALINRLRLHASACRASAFLDLETACTLIDPNAGEEGAARTLVRVLREALNRTPLWHRPGEEALSFDELWLAEVIEAAGRDDSDSLVFLIHRRIAPQKRRLFAMLAHRIADGSF